MTVTDEEEARVVGSDRVLAVLIELAEHPTGVALDELSQRLKSSKSTVHRALTSLRRARLAAQVSRGVYVLGDEFFRLAFQNYEARPEGMLIRPILERLAERYGETVHYAVLEGPEVVYRAKVDSPRGAVRLTSSVGGRNPAYRTAVGKLLLSHQISSESELRALYGGGPLERRTPNTIGSIPELWAELVQTRERGYAIDDQENEAGVNCVAVPAAFEAGFATAGAISISALAFRTPLDLLVREVPNIIDMITHGTSPDL
ncbi:IclR family transcriptional regulator [Sinomonas terrae]|uniref:IclR family transcriptional regulator n=1 Tax=Sinomonas terrae TaxID=2908838 RepID=A0ABS9U5Z1_9MICC|nr:IclR family transcriptional regulator [Sinomonas terrae]MCH6472116.1 IclR family transcriptional regulator [Sinomonas terrae]